MIGVFIEKLKNPKNAVSTLLVGWGLCIVGHLIFTSMRIEPMGQLVAAAGLLMILVTAVRLCATKLLYVGIVGVLCMAYVGVYGASAKWKSSHTTIDKGYSNQAPKAVKRWKPDYSGSGAVKTVKTLAFAPASMGHVILSGKLAGASVEEWMPELKDASTTELGESVRQHKSRSGR